LIAVLREGTIAADFTTLTTCPSSLRAPDGFDTYVFFGSC
jgi:hypothetical protein